MKTEYINKTVHSRTENTKSDLSLVAFNYGDALYRRQWYTSLKPCGMIFLSFSIFKHVSLVFKVNLNTW